MSDPTNPQDPTSKAARKLALIREMIADEEQAIDEIDKEVARLAEVRQVHANELRRNRQQLADELAPAPDRIRPSAARVLADT